MKENHYSEAVNVTSNIEMTWVICKTFKSNFQTVV